MPFSRARSATAFTHSCSRVFVTGVLQLFSDSFFYSRSSYQNFRTVRCNYLCVNVTRGTMYHRGVAPSSSELGGVRGSHDGYEQISYP